VHPGQCKAGELQMIELGADPAIHAVAAFAGRREVTSFMVDDRSQVVLLMAGIAGCREPLKLSAGRILVALVALHQGMRSDQRKAVLVVFNRIQRDIPSFYRVAVFAACAKLTAMNIRMAIGALFADVLKDKAGVAGGASNILMHSTERIARAVMVELGEGANGLPTGGGMAVLTGNR